MQKILFFIFTGLALWSCRRDSLTYNVVVEADDPIILVVSSFKGKVVDEYGAAVAGATVQVFNETTITNAQGQFVFKNVEAPKEGALISVEKNGYFVGSSMSGNKSGGQNYVQVTLLKKGLPQQVSSAAGGTLYWPDGSKITLKPNSLQRANGTAYTGTVNVYARWLDPSADNLGAIMPGALMGVDGEGNERVLATYGMMAFELETPAGEELDIKDGETAGLELPIPPSLGPGAPTEIPLWYFDLEEERWLLRGFCNKAGGSYHCSVVTTGYWNCDIPLEPICLSGTIFQNDSTPAYYTRVIVEDLTDNFVYWGYTDINGFFCGSVPKGAPLRITVKDLCDNVVYTADIGPYAQDFDMGQIFLANTLEEYFIRIYGQLLDCAGLPVTLGQIAVQYPGKIRLFPLDATGTFDFQMALHCVEFPDLLITGHDLTNFKVTPLQTHSDTTEINIGTLTACEIPQDFFHLTVDGNTYSAAPTRFFKKDNVTTNWMVLEALTVGGSFTLDLRQYQGAGQYDDNVIFNTANLTLLPQYPVLNAASPDIPLTIIADDGAFISGQFAGTAYDALNQPHSVNASFKVKKKL